MSDEDLEEETPATWLQILEWLQSLPEGQLNNHAIVYDSYTDRVYPIHKHTIMGDGLEHKMEDYSHPTACIKGYWHPVVHINALE